MRPKALRVHPQEPSPEGLRSYIQSMPGGTKLTGWEDEPHQLLAVWVESDRCRLPLPFIFDAYPPREAVRCPDGGWYLLKVPDLVADMVHWYAEENEWQAEEVHPARGETLEEIQGITAAIWALMPDDGIDEVLGVHDELLDAAAEHQLEAGTLREVTLTLWKDSGDGQHHDSLEKAVAVLAK